MGPVPCMAPRQTWDRSHRLIGTSHYDVQKLRQPQKYRQPKNSRQSQKRRLHKKWDIILIGWKMVEPITREVFKHAKMPPCKGS